MKLIVFTTLVLSQLSLLLLTIYMLIKEEQDMIIRQNENYKVNFIKKFIKCLMSFISKLRFL